MSLSGQCRPVEKRQRSASPSSFSAYTFTRPLPRLSAISIASSARTFSVPCRRKRSATTSSSLRGPVGEATSRSACTRVKPLAASHCSMSAAEVSAGNSTGKVTTRRGSAARVRSISSA